MMGDKIRPQQDDDYYYDYYNNFSLRPSQSVGDQLYNRYGINVFPVVRVMSDLKWRRHVWLVCEQHDVRAQNYRQV